jgi:hypothetical protein
LAAFSGIYLSSCSSTTQPGAPLPASGGLKRNTWSERPGLATTAGSEMNHKVDTVSFFRKSSVPDAVDTFHYNDKPGAEAMAQILGGGRTSSSAMELAGERLEVELRSWQGAYPHLRAKDRNIVIASPGADYSIHFKNKTDKRLELTVAVDSINVLTGTPAALSQHGQVIEPKGTMEIQGFRVNADKVKSFQFGAVGDSVAAKAGKARNVGIIGIAVYEEDAAKAKMHLQSEQFVRDKADAFAVQ